MSWIQRLQDGLAKTRQSVQSSLRRLVGGQLDPAVIEDVEASLLQADVGVRTVQRFLDEINSQTGPFQSTNPLEVLRTLLLDILRKGETEPLEEIIRRGPKPFVLLTIGINGVGKTTTIAKLGHRFNEHGLKTLFVAGRYISCGCY